MNMLEDQLRALMVQPPSTLERSTLVMAGTADQVTRTDSPVGVVWVAWSTRGITALTPTFAAATWDAFMEHHRRRAYETDHLPSDLSDTLHEGLETGDTRGIPVDLAGLAPFQHAVLSACAGIAVGTVRPYGWIAAEIGNPGSVRAVGTALGRNPIPLIIPCHRVVRSDGSIGSYAFGPDMKRDLLIREGAILA